MNIDEFLNDLKKYCTSDPRCKKLYVALAHVSLKTGGHSLNLKEGDRVCIDALLYNRSLGIESCPAIHPDLKGYSVGEYCMFNPNKVRIAKAKAEEDLKRKAGSTGFEPATP